MRLIRRAMGDWLIAIYATNRMSTTTMMSGTRFPELIVTGSAPLAAYLRPPLLLPLERLEEPLLEPLDRLDEPLDEGADGRDTP